MPPRISMGPHGAVTEQAQKSGCSRQSVYDHAQKLKAAVEGERGSAGTGVALEDWQYGHTGLPFQRTSSRCLMQSFSVGYVL